MTEKSILPDLAEIDSVDASTAHFTKLEHNIIWIRYKVIADEFDIQEARNHTEIIEALNNLKSAHLVLDYRFADLSYSNEARNYFAQDERHAKIRLSQAFVLQSLAHKIVANFYLKFHRPSCPARIFNDPEDAVKWILTL